ncbi:hypothetical protein B5S28_g3226 [[Candida] boidinii]|nr:hypothetical protein B5S28_g3226 [[Candida] boidinii]
MTNLISYILNFLIISSIITDTTFAKNVKNVKPLLDQEEIDKRDNEQIYPVILLRPDEKNRVYQMQVQVGSPPQNLTLRLDIGSGDVWLPAAENFSICSSSATTTTTAAAVATSDSSKDETIVLNDDVSESTDYSSATSVLYSDNVCASLGVYDIEDSDSGSYYNVGESISVGKTMNGSTESFKVLPSFIYLSGHYAEDNFSFPMVLDSHLTYLTGENFVFIDVNNSIVSTGGLGVGISTIGSNFIDLFIDKGIVDSNSYSLILNGKDGTYGELVVGAVRNTDFMDSFIEFDFVPMIIQGLDYNSYGLAASYSNEIPIIAISGFGVSSSATNRTVEFSNSYNDELYSGSYPKPIVLDSRSYYNYIPYSTLIDMAVELNAYYAQALDRWVLDCNVGDLGTIDFHFGNYTLNIPISEFIFPAYANNTDTQLQLDNGDNACILSFLPDYYHGFSMFGSTFLRGIVLAVDNENKKLAMGRLNKYNIVYAPAHPNTVFNETDASIIAAIDYQNGVSTVAMGNGTIPFATPNDIADYSDITFTYNTKTFGATEINYSAVTAFISDGEIFVGSDRTELAPTYTNQLSGGALTSISAKASFVVRSTTAKADAPGSLKLGLSAKSSNYALFISMFVALSLLFIGCL